MLFRSVSEVELGGRVLAPEEVEEREAAHDEDDAEGERETLRAVTFDLSGATDDEWFKEPQDRDSGIDLHGDGG